MSEVLQEVVPLAATGAPLLGLVALRVGGVFVFTPVLGDLAVPMTVRAALALLTSAAVAPTLAAAGAVAPGTLPGLAVAVILEVLAGLAVGYAAHAFLAAAELAGSVAGYQAGLDFSRVLDPITGVQLSVVTNIKRIIAVLVFLVLDGHHLVLRAVAASYEVLPLGGGAPSASFASEAIRVSARLIASGLQIAAPVLATTLITDLVLLLVGRAVPQIQILIVGYPLKVAAGLVGVAFALTFFASTARPAIERIPSDALRLLRGLALP